jgi:membrane associated rhomboid family serine protease
MISAKSVSRREPIFTMPGLVLGAILVLIAIHAGRMLLSDVSNVSIMFDFGFVPAQWSVALNAVSIDDVVSAAGLDGGELAELRSAIAHYVLEQTPLRPWSPLTYALLHGSWMHVGLNCVWLAAFATPIVRRCGTARSLVLSVATAFGGALAHWLTHPLGVQPMIGASAIVSGLMGAAATFVFERAPEPDQVQSGRGGGAMRIWAGLQRIARNRTALMFLGSWFVMNLAFGVLATPLGIADAGIAWEAHLGGLVLGLILFPLLDPGPRDWRDWPRGA